MEKDLNYEHALEVYEKILNKDPNVTKDLGELYMVIQLLGKKVGEYASFVPYDYKE